MFLPTCLPLRKSACFRTKSIACCFPLSSVSTICHPTCLPTYLQRVSLSSPHCHASHRVFSNIEESFSPLPFLSLLVPLAFASAFFTCLLIHYCCSLWVLFGTHDSPCPPRVSRLQDLQVLWDNRYSRTFSGLSSVSLPYPPCSSCQSSPPVSIPFLFIPVIALLPACFWAKDTLRLFVSHLFPRLFPLSSQTSFRTSPYVSIALHLSGHIWTHSSPCFPSVSLLASLVLFRFCPQFPAKSLTFFSQAAWELMEEACL